MPDPDDIDLRISNEFIDDTPKYGPITNKKS